jgi:hypothetical protein
MACHVVSAPSIGEMLYDAGVGVGDDEYREGGSQGEEDRKVGVLAQRAKRLFRPVGG